MVLVVTAPVVLVVALTVAVVAAVAVCAYAVRSLTAALRLVDELTRVGFDDVDDESEDGGDDGGEPTTVRAIDYEPSAAS